MRPHSFALTAGRISKAVRLSSIALALLCLVSILHAQDVVSRPTVRLSLIVTDKADRSIDAISKSDVRVFEGNVEQVVESVDADDRPIDYGLLIDSSELVKDRMASFKDTARMIIINRRPEDRIFVARFITSETIEAITGFTGDNDKLLESVDKVRIGRGPSAVIDAIYASTEPIAKRKGGSGRRSGLVVITGGEDHQSYYRLDQLIKQLHQSGVQVFALRLISERDKAKSAVRRNPLEQSERLLKTVAAESGGRAFFPETQAELIDATKQIMVDLRAQFRITYQSTQDSAKKGFRKVEVKLISQTDEKHKAIAPRGYYEGSKVVRVEPLKQKSP